MSVNRSIVPELLDQMSPADTEAQRSRRDLRRLNFLMGNQRWLNRCLARWVKPGERVLEIGAGDGASGQRSHSGYHDGLDRMPRPAEWPASMRWHQRDVEFFEEWSSYPVVCGNLVFHHFSPTTLNRLGTEIRKHARLFLACEPLRSPLWRSLFPLLCTALGASPVTRHDGQISIAAGFRGNELAEAMGFLAAGWRCHTESTRRGATHLLAIRTGS